MGQRRMSLNEAIDKMKSGKFFSCEFTKRTNGETRKMVARTGVRKFVKGTGAPYEFNKKGLLPVFDIQKMEYRCIPLETLRKLNNLPIKKSHLKQIKEILK